MIQVLLRHGFLTSAVLLLIVCSIVCQIIIGVYYQSMLKATENMTATDNKLLKQCKMKFMNCYQVNGGVLNVPVFVDKLLNKIRFMGMTLAGLSRLGGQLILLSVLVSGIGICRLIVTGNDLSELIPYYVLSILGLYLYFSVSSIVDMNRRKKELKVNLVDYLENHLASRIEGVNHVTKKEKEEEESEDISLKKNDNKEERGFLSAAHVFSPKEEAELRALIQDLFLSNQGSS